MQTKRSVSFKREKRIKEAHRLRAEEGLQNAEIAKRIGVSLDTVNDYFRTHQKGTRVNAKRISNQIVGLFIDHGMAIQEIAEKLHVSTELVQVCIQSYPHLLGGGDSNEENLVELRREISILRKQVAQLQDDVRRQRGMILELRRSDSVQSLRISKELDDRLKKARRKYIDGVDDEEKVGDQLSNSRGQGATRRTYRPIT